MDYLQMLKLIQIIWFFFVSFQDLRKNVWLSISFFPLENALSWWTPDLCSIQLTPLLRRPYTNPRFCLPSLKSLSWTKLWRQREKTDFSLFRCPDLVASQLARYMYAKYFTTGQKVEKKLIFFILTSILVYAA